MSFVWKRLLGTVPSLMGVIVLTFFISHALPGDPAANMAWVKSAMKTLCEFVTSFEDKAIPVRQSSAAASPAPLSSLFS